MCSSSPYRACSNLSSTAAHGETTAPQHAAAPARLDAQIAASYGGPRGFTAGGIAFIAFLFFMLQTMLPLRFTSV